MGEKAVRFNRANMVIEIHEEHGDVYEVDLETCTNSAQMLDWVFQVVYKKSISPQVLQDFFSCLEGACFDVFDDSPQGVFCPFGEDQAVKWPPMQD